MRIIYIHQYFTLPVQPGGTRSYEFGRRLVAMGHSVHMITSDCQRLMPVKSKGWFYSQEGGMTVHWLPIPYSNKMEFAARLRAFFEFAFAAAREATSIDGDVVLASSTPLTVAIPGLYTSWRLRVPLVFEVRDLWPHVPIAMGVLRNPLIIGISKLLEKLAYRRASQIIALSPGMRDGIKQHTNCDSKIHVVPNAADLESFVVPESEGKILRDHYAWLGQRPLVVYAGTLGKVNGVSYLVRVAASVGAIDSDIRFLIIGGGKEWNAVEGLAKSLGVLDKNLFMMTSIPKREVPRVLSAADMAASTVIDLPALWDNSANKVFDALAAGRPVAINYEGWQAKLLRESGAGIVLKVNDIGASAKMLVLALHDDAWLSEARRAACKLAADCFSQDRLAAKMESVLLRAVGRAPVDDL